MYSSSWTNHHAEANEMRQAILGIGALVVMGAFVLGCYRLQMDRWRARQRATKPGLTRKVCK